MPAMAILRSGSVRLAPEIKIVKVNRRNLEWEEFRRGFMLVRYWTGASKVQLHERVTAIGVGYSAKMLHDQTNKASPCPMQELLSVRSGVLVRVKFMLDPTSSKQQPARFVALPLWKGGWTRKRPAGEQVCFSRRDGQAEHGEWASSSMLAGSLVGC